MIFDIFRLKLSKLKVTDMQPQIAISHKYVTTQATVHPFSIFPKQFDVECSNRLCRFLFPRASLPTKDIFNVFSFEFLYLHSLCIKRLSYLTKYQPPMHSEEFIILFLAKSRLWLRSISIQPLKCEVAMTKQNTKGFPSDKKRKARETSTTKQFFLLLFSGQH